MAAQKSPRKSKDSSGDRETAQLSLGFEESGSGLRPDGDELVWLSSCSYRQALLHQIRRDVQTLDDPDYHMDEDPCGEDFYLDRILAYREEIKRLPE